MSDQKRNIISETGHHFSVPRGISMNPMLYELDSIVDIVPLDGMLKKGDVALYESPKGDRCVLHRVVDVKSDHYIFRGDNCSFDEFVPFEAVIGVAAQFKRHADDDWTSVDDPKYQRYVRFVFGSWFIRKPVLKLRDKLRSLRSRFAKTKVGGAVKRIIRKKR